MLEQCNMLVSLRRDLLAIINGIEDAEPTLWWDDTTPNFRTRSRLRAVVEAAIQAAPKFGVYVVTRHSSCGRRAHSKASDDNDYVWSDPYGLDIVWRDERYEWRGDQLFQGEKLETCPCSTSDELLRHYVIQDFVFERGADRSVGRTFCAILSDIQAAMDQSGDKQPRSGIREHLLRAVLVLNDTIMPTTVDEHIRANTPPMA
jgi:hypothetical protein